MGDLYRVSKLFWAPSDTFSDAARAPFVMAPLLVPTVFAAITSLVVYFKFPPADAALRTVWLMGLISATVGPALIAMIVASFFFGVFSLAGRKHGFSSFLSVTALAFVPTVIRHMTQGSLLLWSSGPLPPTLQVGRLNLALLVDPQTVSPQIFVAAGMIDAVSIWVLVLMIFGYRFLGSRPSRFASPALVIGGWLLYATVRIALAATVTF